METVPDIFEHLGGASRVARILGVGQSTASEMKRRGSIPVRWWPTLLASDEAREIGVTEGLLIRIHAQQANEASQ